MSVPVCRVVKATAAPAPDCMVALDIQLHGAAEFLFLIPAEGIPTLAAQLLFAAREMATTPAPKEARP